ncbi:sensor histidine kinase [Streptomyces corynorhini]|uniref:histidine kinase n=1 Tax=Streptomyces corynorhini TaxID=2282652 RepID=A0A370BEE6_9ACTN|nr:histidine kinase [Streptomyces corynorhini]RDG40070.1 sensor histidine kinase [Streptomyces corynorhini]
MTPQPWTNWPSREALSREGLTDARRRLSAAVRLLVCGALLWSTFSQRHVSGWSAVAAVAGVFAVGFCAWGFYRTTLSHRLWPSVALLLLLLGAAFAADQTGFGVAAVVLWCGCAVTCIERLPLIIALPTALAAFTGYTILTGEELLSTLITTVGLFLGGYVLRLDAEARGNAHRLLAQERAARAAEAETAALAERARIARDIHDVLAHSLSAQLVHLEAARLRIEQEPRGPFRDQILERVVAARSMAREGLAETRQALSALRGEMAPLGDYLRELAATDGAEVGVEGTPRPLPAEVSQTVRRVAQEALTNVRKHAPGARVSILLRYGADDVVLVVRDSGGRGRVPAGLPMSGSGYGLLGMRERAELLGGALEAGGVPDEEGFSVRLRVPA